MSKIPFRAFPISLEQDPNWINLSLKRRVLFQYIVWRCVYSQSHMFQEIELTFGQYVKSFGDLAKEFNETVNDSEDKIDKSFVKRAVDKYVEINLISYVVIGVSIRSKTIISITHSDTLEIIKMGCDTIKGTSDTIAIRKGNISAIRSEETENDPHIIPITGNDEVEKEGCDTTNNNFEKGGAIRLTRTNRTNLKVCMFVADSETKFENYKEEQEEMQSPLLVFQHRKHKTISIRKNDLIAELKNMASPFMDDEIEEGIKIMQDSNVFLSGSIQKYIIGIIENKREQKKLETIRNNSYGRKTNKPDLVSRSGKTFTEPTVHYKGKKL